MVKNNKSSSLPLVIFLLIIFGIVTYAVFHYLPENLEKGRAAVTGALTKDDVRTIIREELQNNPEIVVSALEAFHTKKEQEAQEKSKQNIASNKGQLEDDSNTPFAGNAKGDVTLVEFFDYSCGYCKRNAPVLTELLKSDPNLKIVFREWPILGPVSQRAAQIALSVHAVDKSKYLDFHNALMAASGVNTEEAMLDIVTKIGVDADKVKALMDKPEIMAEITKNRTLARLIGVQGTPAFVIGGELLSGAADLDTLKKKVAEARARAASAAPATNNQPAADKGPQADANKQPATGEENKAAPAGDAANPAAPADGKKEGAPAAPAAPTDKPAETGGADKENEAASDTAENPPAE